MLLAWIPLAMAEPVWFPCGTLDMRPTVRPVLADAPPPPAGKGLEVRDPFGSDYDGIEESQHFALKWGWDDEPSNAQIDGTLAALEDAWTLAFDDMGFDRPGFTNQFKVNVYVGNSGGDTPDIPSSLGGYTTLDGGGYGYIVMHPNVLEGYDKGDPEYADSVVEHEFHHVVQFGAGAYWTDEGSWYWEASASWFADFAVPDAYGVATDGALFRMMPELSLDFFDRDDPTLAGYHQYASSVLLTAITEWADGDPSIITDSWTQAATSQAPIDVLDGIVPGGMAETYTKFALALTTYDFAFGELLSKYFLWYADYEGDQNHAIAIDVDGAGSPTPIDVDEELLPGAFSYNVIRMPHPVPGTVDVAFVGDPRGSRGTAASFDVWIVPSRSGAATPVLLELTEGSGTYEVPSTSSLDDLTVIVVSHPAERVSAETFGYDLTLAAGAPPPEEDTGEPDGQLPDLGDEEPGGCGCASTGPFATGWFALAGLALSLRRRRA